MPIKKKLHFLASMIAVATLAGCVTPPTWTNRGPIELATEKGRIACYTDANIIDGERMEGTLCATAESGFFGGGEPEIYFGPWNRKFIKEPVSKTTVGITQDYQGKKVFLQCEPVLGSDKKVEIERKCKVTINDQLLVSANVTYSK
ncbi:hypothetical protein [Pseudomonas fluorescens]|uniref:hypothetical protein n=1 Tax=Pseudomonas fluorescens TaxID=294 RepID=UPI003D06DE63